MISFPSKPTMTSPLWIPPASAGPPGTTSPTRAPFGFLQFERLGHFRGDILDRYPDPSSNDLALLFQLVEDLFGHIARDGKSDPLAAGNDGGVDPDHLSLEINERPSAIAGIDRRIGLQKIVIRSRSR